MVGWLGGQVVRWSGGRVVAWSGGWVVIRYVTGCQAARSAFGGRSSSHNSSRIFVTSALRTGISSLAVSHTVSRSTPK
ncbi:MAG: hypothetical protein D6759_06880 [Chloroflexi bacterium]|nr:MAG: hypothetical protein D6759_06880 [Chloroflexota bacterium]